MPASCLLLWLSVPAPVASRIAKRVSRHVSHEVCPWNEKFATVLAEDSPYRPREALAGEDARQLARDLLGMTQEDFSRTFRGSPMKRAKLRGLRRNAAVVLGNPSMRSGPAARADDVDVLTRALDDPEPLVREHAAWAPDRLRVGPPSEERVGGG